jgi:hypothetical protein
MNNSTQNLSVFGWNWTFFGDIKITTDSEGNVSIANSGIQSLFPQQLSGTALYGTDIQGLAAKQLANAPHDLGTQQLFAQGSASERTFALQTDGSYQASDKDKGILTKSGNIYQLKEKDGTVIVFRADGQLDYVQDANG